VIENILLDIEKYCDEKSILIFEGFNENEFSVINTYIFDDQKDNNWKSFFDFVSKLDIKIVVIENHYNEIKTLLEIYESTRDSLLKHDIKFEKKKYDNLDELSKFDGKINKSIISFTHCNNCYKLFLNSEMFYEYILIEKQIQIDIENFDEALNTKSPLKIENDKLILTDETINQLLDEFILNEKDILEERDKNERKKRIANFIEIKFSNNINRISYIEIIKGFEKIYENNLMNKVLELKSHGLKKVSIGSKLQIGEKLVNRFYESN
jgi:hypothetical protein